MKNLLALLLLLASAVIVFGQETVKNLTNQDVIEMSRAALPESVIISKIKVSPNSFTTDLESLKTLNAEKVPANVISAMIEQQSPVESPVESLDEALLKSPPSKTEPATVHTPKPVARLFTPYGELSKNEQKQRLKSPAHIEIAAPAAKTAEFLIRAFQSWDYQIESETARSLILSKEVPGIGNQMLVGMAMGGNNLRYKIQVSMSETGGLTDVVINFAMTSENGFGRTNSKNVNQNKKLRMQLDELLIDVKNSAESSQPYKP